MKTVTYDETKFKLVPVEASSTEMPEAGLQRLQSLYPGYPELFSRYAAMEVYRAMLAASPVAERPPAQQQQPQTAYGLLFKKSPYWVGVWNDRDIAEHMQAKLAKRGDASTIVEFSYDAPAAPMTTTDEMGVGRVTAPITASDSRSPPPSLPSTKEKP